MTREEAIAYFEECNERIIAASKDENIYDYEKQEIMDVFMRRTYEANVWAISALSEVKAEWIPVSERLPEEREWYLAVFKEKDTDFQLIPRVADYIGHGENKWRWIDEEGLPQEYFDLLECVAWQPLPEPYKAESEFIKKSCNTCKNNDDELSGECYECLKGIFDHYEPEEEKARK